MEGTRGGRKWKNLKQRLRLKGLGCCGNTWGFGAPTRMHVREDEAAAAATEEETRRDVATEEEENRAEEDTNACVGQIPAATGMNLATALAVERNFRAAHDVNSTPERVSLMRRMVEEEEEEEEKEGEGKGGGGNGMGSGCIVCMGRRKGAAFIPCGHTFCRVCSRELWLNRGSCPLCNRSILEILDIF